MLKFGEWLPDIGPLENPGLIDAQNVLPSSAGYRPLLEPVEPIVSRMDGPALGGISVRDAQTFNTIYNYIGTADKLYSYTIAAGFTDVSKGGGYATASGERWEFAHWGNTVIATNFSNVVQVITLGGANFGDLGGTPPQARHIGIVENFVVLGNTFDGANYTPQRVQWSGIGNSATWAVSATTQADYNDLQNNGGYIQRIIGGEFGLIFQEKCITRMQYIGSPLVFQFDLVESQRGALAAGSVIQIGNNVAYLAEDGFFVFDGQQSIPIGDGKVNQTFFENVDIHNLGSMSVDAYPEENIIVWSYASLDAVGGIPDTLLFYNYAPNSPVRWSYAKVNNYLLISPISKSYTLDGLDAVDTNLDTLTPSLDSPVWMGSVNIQAIINTSYGLSLLSGAAFNTRIETGEAWLQEPNRTYLTLVRPHINLFTGTGTVTAQVAARNLENDPISYGANCTQNTAGFIPVRANARFMRLVFNMTGSYNQAQGFDIISSAAVGRQ